MSAVLPGAPFLARDGDRLCLEGHALDALAERFGTPLYVYSRQAMCAALAGYRQALAGRRHLLCYAMKANPNLAVLQTFAQAGCGFDIVSGGELARVLAAGGDAAKVVFSGVGKTGAEMRQALHAGVRCFNVESRDELDRLDAEARALGLIAPVSLRVNPDVDAGTHPYISTGLKDNKFGIAHGDAVAAYRHAASLPGLRVVGIDCHIGSQITRLAPYLDAADRLFDLVEAVEAAGVPLAHVDFGGGLGIDYGAPAGDEGASAGAASAGAGEAGAAAPAGAAAAEADDAAAAEADGDAAPLTPGRLVRALLARADARGHGAREFLFEPGRSLVGNAGVLVTEVLVLKSTGDKRFAVVDAAMNDLLRPALYQAWMAVEPCRRRDGPAPEWDIVGPVCESGDWLARARSLALRTGDRLAVLSAGAYGMAMASNYNSRARAAEVVVDGNAVHLVRERETVDALFAGERLI